MFPILNLKNDPKKRFFETSVMTYFCTFFSHFAILFYIWTYRRDQANMLAMRFVIDVTYVYTSIQMNRYRGRIERNGQTRKATIFQGSNCNAEDRNVSPKTKKARIGRLRTCRDRGTRRGSSWRAHAASFFTK